ncbi:hypothetical protein [Myceligenerans crystallogenes]|uniref:Flp pilus-assembly TadE/G-like n=1 Tax=Myceligenerans crystallogenes TaxID=316335 RepID=A0ABN2N6F6_9MICO
MSGTLRRIAHLVCPPPASPQAPSWERSPSPPSPSGRPPHVPPPRQQSAPSPHAPPSSSGISARPAGDDGRILLLTLAFVAFAVALVGVIASASAVHLDRKRLADLADLLAADAAQAVSEERLYARGLGDPRAGTGLLALDDDAVAAAVDRYLAEHPAAAPEGLVVTEAGSPDGRSARVSLAAPSRPPLLEWFTHETAPIVLTATSTARAW